MPTADPTLRLDPADVHEAVAELAFPPAGQDDQRGIGLETELFGVTFDGRDPRRLTIAEQSARLDELARDGATVAAATPGATTPAWPAGSGRITFEPGGQIEYSGGVHATGADALDDQDRVMDALATRWAREGDLLAGAGLDVWTSLDDVAQQLDAPRYRAMDAYLSHTGRAGRRMMRHTCALQVNLDPGTGDVADERWRLANLLSPTLTAVFACSPAPDPDPAVSLRARSWRQLDPTRTGVPDAAQLGAPGDRVRTMTRFALDADVMLLHGRDGRARPGPHAWSFGQWLREGHPMDGWPTYDDLRVHLSTLFPEVRPRGPLELRSIDALPRRWRSVPVVLVTGLLYDEQARAEALRLRAPQSAQLRDDLVRAGEVGLKDGELCAAAVELCTLGIEGARRLGDGWHRPDDLVGAEAFVDHFTMRGRSPSDELRETHAAGHHQSLLWAAEPLPEIVLESR